jgi:AraC family transcriptional regulator
VRVGLVYLRPRRVGFVRVHGAYKQSSVAAWQTMAEWLERHDLTAQVSCGYGLAQDNPDSVAPQLCRYDACIELPDGYQNLKSDSLPFQVLPGGAFARIRHVGSYSTIRKSLAKVRDTWLPSQPRVLIDRRRPLLVVYLDDPNSRDATKLRCDVCIPVRTHHDDAITRSKLAQVLAGPDAEAGASLPG